ncbi:hypothetical protein BH09SUM1_BH09SUM1_06240 [soil metagenome]
MGYEVNYGSICAQVNASLDVESLIGYVNWHPDKLVRSGDVYHALCPIHRETIFRTLTLNPRNNTYHCKHVNCPGNYTSDFLDLIVKVSGKSLPEVMMGLVQSFGPERFRLTSRQMKILDELMSTPPDGPGPGAAQ